MANHWFKKPITIVFTPLLLVLVLAVACGAAATATPVPKAPAAPEAPKAPVAPTPVGAAPTAPAATTVPVAKLTPTPAPAIPARPSVERLKIAIAPVGQDTNITWEATRLSNLEKRPLLEYLIGIDRKTGALIPELATRWQMAPDGKSWTFWLRKGIQFHDSWGEFTAKDVVHSRDVYALSAGAIGSDSPFWKDVIERMEVVDDYQVVFHLTRVDPELEEPASALRDLMIQSKAFWDKEGKEGYKRKIVGTGPFKYVERKEGQHVLFARVDNHWRQTPEVKEVQIAFPPEDLTRMAALLAGEVQMSDIPRELYGQAEARGMKIIPSSLPAITLQWYFGGMYFATPANVDSNAPFVNKKVRQAMNMAVNRKEIGDTILGGRVQPLRVHNHYPAFDTPKGIWNPEWERQFDGLYGYNPTKAKALLAEAGYASGFGFKVYLYPWPGLPEMKQIGEALALYWKAVGLNPQLEELDFPRVRELYRTQKIHGAMWALAHGPIGHSITMRQFHISKGGTVYSYHDPVFEQLWTDLGKLVDRVERNKIYRQVGDRKFFEFTEVPTFWMTVSAAVNPKHIAEYQFPGTITGYFTHLEYIKLAK